MSTEVQAALDERLQAALESANFRVTLQNQKSNLKLKYANDLVFSYNGGIFNITQQLISFVSSLVNLGKSSSVLVDNNGNPVEVSDLTKFQEDIIERYYEASNSFLSEYKALQKSRNVKSLVKE